MYSSDLLSFSGRGYFLGSGGCCQAGFVDMLYYNEIPLLYVCMLPVMIILMLMEFYTLVDHIISLTPEKSPIVTRPLITVDFSRLAHVVPGSGRLLLFTKKKKGKKKKSVWLS